MRNRYNSARTVRLPEGRQWERAGSLSARSRASARGFGGRNADEGERLTAEPQRTQRSERAKIGGCSSRRLRRYNVRFDVDWEPPNLPLISASSAARRLKLRESAGSLSVRSPGSWRSWNSWRPHRSRPHCSLNVVGRTATGTSLCFEVRCWIASAPSFKPYLPLLPAEVKREVFAGRGGGEGEGAHLDARGEHAHACFVHAEVGVAKIADAERGEAERLHFGVLGT